MYEQGQNTEKHKGCSEEEGALGLGLEEMGKMRVNFWPRAQHGKVLKGDKAQQNLHGK